MGFWEALGLPGGDLEELGKESAPHLGCSQGKPGLAS